MLGLGENVDTSPELGSREQLGGVIGASTWAVETLDHELG
jgi:hypothetical protein